MTTATMQTVILDVPVSSIHDDMPRQNLDEGEHIVRRIVPIDDLNDILRGWFSTFTMHTTATHCGSNYLHLDYAAKGCAIDARLSHFALSWNLSQRLTAGELLSSRKS